MDKTNLRIDNNFIIIDEDENYYLTDISDPDKWSKEIDLSKYSSNEVTEELEKLMEEYKITSNVNFCGFDIQKPQSGGGDLILKPHFGGGG